MFRPRIIPLLLLDGTALVKTIRFGAGKYIGDPVNAVKLFNDLEVDELVFLDITATRENRTISPALIEQIGSEANMPFAVGGGIHKLEHIRHGLAAGAERVVLNVHALDCPGFVRDAAGAFGSSTVSVCVDVKRTWLGQERVYRHTSRKKTSYDALKYVKMIQDMGAGELILQSVDRDGVMGGYDLDLIRAVSETVSIPVVALGGAGSSSDLSKAYFNGYASAVAAGSLFVYQGKKRGVLINYPSAEEARALFKERGAESACGKQDHTANAPTA